VKQTLRSLWLPGCSSSWLALLGGLLPLAAWPQQSPLPQRLSAYAAADQARFGPGAPGPAAPAKLPPPGTWVLRPGAAVFGWLPAWMPAGYVRQVDFTLLSHVAYEGYQATEQGGLRAPTAGDASTLAATVHQANPRCRVLLSVGYQEPAGGGSVFGAAAAPAQQALVQAVAQQVAALKADGVNLDFTFRPLAPAPPPPARQATKAELSRNLHRLDNTLIQLNKQKPIVAGDSGALVKEKAAMDALQTVPPKLLRDYDHRLKMHQATAAKLRLDLAAYHSALAAQKKGLLLPAALPAIDGRPAAVAAFVQALGQALRQQNPAATLTLSLPAVDSARVYGRLPTLAPALQLFVLKAFDYTVGQHKAPGPLAALKPSPTGGSYAVATSVSYYLGQGIAATKLLVGLPSLGKVWFKYANPPIDSTMVAPYQYLSNQGLGLRGRASKKVDASTGSTLVLLRPDPDSAQSKHLQIPQLAWVDDSASVAAHYAWVRQQQLGGVGIWALGFDAPDAPIWNIVRANFATPAPAADSTRRAPWTPAGTVKKGETWLELSPLAHVLLFGLALLLLGAWLGLALVAARRVPYWVPFPRRLLLMSGLLLGGATLLALYGCLLGSFDRQHLLVGWLTALGLVAGGGLSYYLARPKELP
jgi:GH18 family chitinase